MRTIEWDELFRLAAAEPEDSVVLTATRRLAAVLRARHDARQMSRGLAAWPDPVIRPYAGWVADMARQFLETGSRSAGSAAAGGTVERSADRVLSERQSLAVWEEIIAREGPADLLRPDGAARAARDAWSLVLQWKPRQQSAGRRGNLSAEEGAFGRWSTAYRETLRSRGWLDQAELPDLLAAGWRAAPRGDGEDPASGLPRRVLLAGFDELPPQDMLLLEALESLGCEMLWLGGEESVSADGAALRVAGFADQEAEVWAAARWARERLESGEGSSADPVGVVVPGLTALRALVERVFSDVFTPGDVLRPAAAAGRAFNISAGLPLSEYPLVAAALSLLRLSPGPPEPETLRTLLLSPWTLGAGAEEGPRARLEQRILEMGGGTGGPGLGALERLASQVGRPWSSPQLALALGAGRKIMVSLPARQAPSAWVDSFGALLAALGWPGRKLDSAEHQTLEKWKESLAELARLEPVLPSLSRERALSWLRRITSEELFQPRSDPAPVQVLGVLEAGGQRFSRLWVLGLHDEAWPPAPRPNPFIPVSLQAQCNMPHSSARRELEWARVETLRLCGAAPEVVFSFPRKDGERELRPSPLLPVADQALPGQGTQDGGAPLPEFWGAVGGSGRPEWLDDSRVNPLALDTAVHGGSALFQDQSACPFRAFARHRLFASTPGEPQPGLDGLTRGILVHGALAAFWKKTVSQRELLGLDTGELERRMDEAAAAALEHWLAERVESPGRRLLELERRRLLVVMGEILEKEKARAPFMVVEQELDRNFSLGGIEVRARIDRVDRLEESLPGREPEHLIIDVKTGQVAGPRVWLGERPDEPQLPLYSVCSGFGLAGVAFAAVRKGESGFKGVASRQGLYPGEQMVQGLPVPDGAEPCGSMEDLLKQWQVTLERLGRDFREGDARVAPKAPPETCRFCDLHALCRVNEFVFGAAAEEDSDE
ncbi:MAG: PD-(D/E)XK nuclease family protein [Deltaproteobacteria bacterium]|nr:PD-(D/E)XK nuclease family protein [Deltaproteobacteria bacterium]